MITVDWLLEELLKDKLQQWLSSKLHAKNNQTSDSMDGLAYTGLHTLEGEIKYIQNQSIHSLHLGARKSFYLMDFSYQTRAEMLLQSYMSSDSFVVYSSVIGGIFACKMVYDLSQILTSIYFKGYASLSKPQQVEWCNRSISTVHAIFITTMSLYLAFWSGLFSDDQLSGLVTQRSSILSTFVLGVSLGYFISDLAMILWFYPSLGGLEYVVHHLLSMVAITYAMLTGDGQLYVYMVLVSEATTPGINLRWYLDVAGLKKSKAYLINGFMMVFAWLVARILLFIYLFCHIYIHYDQIKQMHSLGIVLMSVVPTVIAAMNLVWFWKIVKGLMKTLAKRH